MVNLRGDTLSNAVAVKAHGLPGSECANMEESCKTEAEGQFRIRGLKVTLTTKYGYLSLFADKSVM